MLEFSNVDEIDPGRKFSGVPPAKLNYGLYTGNEVHHPWNAPSIKPTAESYAENLIKSGQQVKAATSHLTQHRYGNNEPDYGVFSDACVPDAPDYSPFCLR